MAWPRDAYVGQKVVCVNDKPERGCRWTNGEQVQFGQIYSIASIAVNDEGAIVVLLNEKQRKNDMIKENSWYAWYGIFRFKPLEERKTDISIFTKMLNPNKELANV